MSHVKGHRFIKMPTKTTTTKKTTKPRAPRKTAAKPAAAHAKKAAEPKAEAAKTAEVQHLPKGEYVFATGRRKTSIANVRLFSGKGESIVNKKPFATYFGYTIYQNEVNRPFEVTGLVNHYHFVCSVNGGGPHSQAQALRHGISLALSRISPEVRKVLKKNGYLTRDDRQKERKKPGLKRARRAPQWAKR